MCFKKKKKKNKETLQILLPVTLIPMITSLTPLSDRNRKSRDWLLQIVEDVEEAWKEGRKHEAEMIQTGPLN